MKIAMIGAGGYARAHLQVLSREPGVEVVGHVSATAASRETAAAQWGGRAYSSCEELLEREQVEAAWVTVPPYAHGQIERCLIERGIPFFVEKPLAVDRETAEEIASAIAAKELAVGVGYHWRAMDTMPEVRAALSKTPAHLILGAWHGSTPAPRWWQRQETSGGQMVEQATHLFDIARALVGEAQVIASTADHHPRQGFEEMDVADVSTALLRFESGATGVFTATCLLEGTEEVYLKLVCEGLLMTVTRQKVIFEQGRETRHLSLGELPIVVEDRSFLEAVRTGNRELLFSSYEDALLTHRLCFDVLEASRQTRPQQVDGPHDRRP